MGNYIMLCHNYVTTNYVLFSFTAHFMLIISNGIVTIIFATIQLLYPIEKQCALLRVMCHDIATYAIIYLMEFYVTTST